MKKSPFLLFTGLITSIILLFVSCENFMNGSNIQEQLEEMIDVANAKSYIIIVQRQDSEVGAFLSDGDKECKVGYSIDLQFTVNSENYKYLGMEAVSKVNPTKSRSDCVEFIEMSSEPEEKSGIFKVQVKLIKESDDIMIRPKCVLLPKVTQIKPDLIPTGYDQDEIVKITFNKAIDNTEKPFENFNNISIFSDTSDLQDYFDEPYFTDGDTVLNLRPKQDIHILTPDSNQKTNVTVIIDLLEVKDTDGEALAQKINHTYRINDSFGNQKTTIIRAREDENSITGTFDKTGDIQCTVGYSKDFQFTVKKASYVFKGLTATTSDGTPIDEATVEFTQVKADEEAGIYTIRVLVKQEPAEEVEAIVIKPNCVLIPKVVEITPDYKPEGYYQDTQLAIKFNKEVDPESFFDEDGTIIGLSISSDDGDMLSYYNTPEFSEDKKTLYIKPLSATDASKLILPPDQSRNNMDLKLQYNFAEAKDADGLSIEQSGLHEYKINKTFTNQKIVTVLIEADEAYGKFLSAGEKECTVGYTLDFQFTIKKADYAFEGFEAVSTGATSESRADYVVFEAPDFDFDNGVFKAKVRIKQEKNDIQIRPKCKLIPKVTSVGPAMSANGIAQDSEIEITFNKAVNTENFNTLAPVYIYSADGDNLTSYFGAPHFSADSKTLIITPLSTSDLTKVILPPDGTKNSQNLKVQYDFSKAKDVEGLSINQAGSFDYKINKEFAIQRMVSLLIPANDEHGTFLSTGQKECSVGFTTDLQFTLDKANYIFTGFDAVSNEDESVSRASYVSFESLDANDEKGIYKAKIRVNNLATIPEDIKIIPKCVPVPKITGMEPENNYDGVQQDSTISLIFNKPVTSVGAIEYLKTALTITDSSGQSLAPYFGDPYFSADSTILYIPTVKTVRLLSSKTDKKDIVVKFDLSSIKDELGNVGSGFYQNKYRVNGTLDSIKPTLNTVTVYSCQDTTDKNYKQLSSKAFSDWAASNVSTEDYEANLVRASVYAELDGNDIGSGIAGVHISEKLIKYSDGTSGDASESPIETRLDCTRNEQTGKYCCNYEMKTVMDGIIELEFSLEDYAGNISEKKEKYYVLKDTVIDSTLIKFDEEVSNLESTVEAWVAASNVSDENGLQTVELHLGNDIKDSYYPNCDSEYEIEAYWGYTSADITNRITISNGTYTFTRDITKFVYIKLLVTDKIGNTKEIIKTMDPRPNIKFSFNETNISQSSLSLNDFNTTKIMAGRKTGDELNTYVYFIMAIYDNANAEGTPVKRMQFTENVLGNYPSDWLQIYWWNNYEIPEGNIVRIYAISCCGDFASPVTKDYVEYIIQEWPGASFSDNSNLVFAQNHAPALVSSNGSNSGSSTSGQIVDAYGPENTPYINEPFSVTAEEIKGTGTYKITVSDYKTAAAPADVKYEFYAVERMSAGPLAPDDPLYDSYDANADENCFTGATYTDDSPVFYLRGGSMYKLFIKAVASDGTAYIPNFDPSQMYESHEYGNQEGLSFYYNSGTETQKRLEFTKDVIPPYTKEDPSANPFEYCNPGSVTIFKGEDSYENNRSTMYKNKEGKYELTYYLIPSSGKGLQRGLTFTRDELEKYYSKYERKIEYKAFNPMLDQNDPDYNDEYRLQIPVGNEKEGVYNLSIVYEDKYGNYSIVTMPIINRVLGELDFETETHDVHFMTDDSNHGVPTLQFTLGQNDTINIYPLMNNWQGSSSWGEGPLATLNASAPSYDPSGAVWNEVNQESVANDWNNTQSQIGKWYKLSGYRYSNTMSAIETGFFNTKYIYFDSIYNIECNSKNCLTGLNGIQIFCDKPVFAHTMYYVGNKLTEDTDDNAITIWESKGVETGIRTFSPENNTASSFTYGNNNYDSIPSGAWYTTIVHFADGTTVMTEIQQKK